MHQHERERIIAEAKAHLAGTWTPPPEPERSPPVTKSEQTDLIRTEPIYTERTNGHAVAVHHTNTAASEPQRIIKYATEYRLDGSDSEHPEEVQWNGWLQRNLLRERQLMAGTIAEVFVDVEDKVAALERRVERLTGALDVLSVGRMMRVKGTFNPDAADSYKQCDVVMVNGSSFVALEDRPGPCPGENWQLLASAGRRGERGFRGEKGERGEPGLSAPAAASIRGLHVDPKTYMLSILTGDRKFHQLSLRALFQHFFNEARRSL